MKTYLVIDDMPDMLDIISKEFESTKEARVFTAQDISSSQDLLIKKKFDLIICDFKMPDGNAESVLNFMKNNQINTPMIIFTSRFDLEMP